MVTGMNAGCLLTQRPCLSTTSPGRTSRTGHLHGPAVALAPHSCPHTAVTQSPT